MTSYESAMLLANTLDGKKGEEIKVLKTEGLTTLADYFVICTATSTTANSVGVGGLPGILSIQPASMLSFALCMVIAIVIPFVLTVVMGKKKGVA